MIYKKAGITDLFTTENISIEESVKKLATLPLHHNPGEKFTYSEGLDVLGYFIEIVSGMPFDVYLRKHLFDPLGMNDTWFYLPGSKADRLVSVQKMENGFAILSPFTIQIIQSKGPNASSQGEQGYPVRQKTMQRFFKCI